MTRVSTLKMRSTMFWFLLIQQANSLRFWGVNRKKKWCVCVFEIFNMTPFTYINFSRQEAVIIKHGVLVGIMQDWLSSGTFFSGKIFIRHQKKKNFMLLDSSIWLVSYKFVSASDNKSFKRVILCYSGLRWENQINCALFDRKCP